MPPPHCFIDIHAGHSNFVLHFKLDEFAAIYVAVKIGLNLRKTKVAQFDRCTIATYILVQRDNTIDRSLVRVEIFSAGASECVPAGLSLKRRAIFHREPFEGERRVPKGFEGAFSL